MAIAMLLLKVLLGLLIFSLVFIICILGLAIWSVPRLAPKILDSWIESKTGFSATVNSVNLKVFSGSLRVEGLALINPPNYQTKNFMQIRQIAVQMRPKTVYKSKAVFDYLLIDVERLTLVKNAQGIINIQEFVKKLKKSKKKEGKEKGRNIFSKNEYIIKNLVIKIEEIDVIGLAFEEDRRNFALRYEKKFTDVADIESVINQVMADLIGRGVIDFTLDVLERKIGGPEFKVE